MSSPVADAIRLLNEAGSLYEDPALTEAADALAAYFADPQPAEIDRLADAHRHTGGRIVEGGLYMPPALVDRIRAVLKAIPGSEQP